MSLTNQDTSMVDGFCVPQLEHKCLETTLQEVRRLQRQNIIQAFLRLIKQTVAVHTLKKRIALENSTGIALLKGEQRTGSIPDLGQLHLHTPKLALIAKPIFSDQLQLSIQTLLLVRTAGLLECLTICRPPLCCTSAWNKHTNKHNIMHPR